MVCPCLSFRCSFQDKTKRNCFKKHSEWEGCIFYFLSMVNIQNLIWWFFFSPVVIVTAIAMLKFQLSWWVWSCLSGPACKAVVGGVFLLSAGPHSATNVSAWSTKTQYNRKKKRFRWLHQCPMISWEAVQNARTQTVSWSNSLVVLSLLAFASGLFHYLKDVLCVVMGYGRDMTMPLFNTNLRLCLDCCRKPSMVFVLSTLTIMVLLCCLEKVLGALGCNKSRFSRCSCTCTRDG